MDAPFQLYLSEQEAPVFVENGVFFGQRAVRERGGLCL